MNESFMWGVAIGGGVFAFLSSYQHAFYKKILAGKAKGEHRTPERLGDDFYYIVPEKEFNEMERMCAWYRNGSSVSETADET